MTDRGAVLVVDDEESLVFAMRHFFRRHGFGVDAAASVAEARDVLRQATPDVIILDQGLADGDGLELLRWLRAEERALPVVMLTGRGTIDLAVRAVKEGAEQVLTKPAELPSLLGLVEEIVARRRSGPPPERGAEPTGPDPFLGACPALRRLESESRSAAGSSAPVLIEGETGSGKGVLARWLHDRGPRCAEPFVDLNCAGLSRELVESELFGHEKGSFTGAVATRPGLLDLAHRGTLFLDEIGDMSPHIQPRLLKVLEEKRFRRVGDLKQRSVDVRLVAATHQDLARLVREGSFRADLLYRINALRLHVPPLRERGNDVVLLARHVLESMNRAEGRTHRLLPGAERALLGHAWPGNVRELRNVLERAVVGATSDALDAAAVAAAIPPPPSGGPVASQAEDLPLKEVERRHITLVLDTHGGDVEHSARVLGLSRSALYQKLRKHQLATRR